MISQQYNLELLNSFSEYKITIHPFTKVLTYLINNQIVAFLDYSLIYDKIEINYIFVKEEYRNQKIAFKLLDYMIEYNEFENITLEVSTNNFYAISLYRSFGFKVVATRKNYYFNSDAYLMEVKYEHFSR